MVRPERPKRDAFFSAEAQANIKAVWKLSCDDDTRHKILRAFIGEVFDEAHKKGWTHSALSEASGLSEGTISMYFHGLTRLPRVCTAMKFATAVGWEAKLTQRVGIT